MSGNDLAEKALLGSATIARAEAAEGELPITAANAAAIRNALEAEGVIFIDPDDAGGPGVRLKK